MESFEIPDVITMQKSLGEKYLEFFKGDNVSPVYIRCLSARKSNSNPTRTMKCITLSADTPR